MGRSRTHRNLCGNRDDPTAADRMRKYRRRQKQKLIDAGWAEEPHYTQWLEHEFAVNRPLEETKGEQHEHN